MSRAAVERKLRKVNDDLRRARAELTVLDEQAAHFLLEQDALDPDASRHADVHGRARDRVVARVRELEQARDDLLDRLVLESR